jgi:AcrR family transcriptional regulator
MSSAPRRTKSEQKRQQMLLAASDLFLENGFDRISMDQVAEAAGVSKQTVYSHFGSKEELFTAVIEYKCAIHELTDELFDLNRPVHDVLKELVVHFSDLLMSDAAICMFKICIADHGQSSQIAELYWKAGPQRLTHRFCQYLEAQIANGKLHIDKPHFAAQQLLSMIKAEAYIMKALGQPADHNQQELNDYLDSCVAVFEQVYLN